MNQAVDKGVKDSTISDDWGPDWNADPDGDGAAFSREEGLVWVDGYGWCMPDDAKVVDEQG